VVHIAGDRIDFSGVDRCENDRCVLRRYPNTWMGRGCGISRVNVYVEVGPVDSNKQTNAVCEERADIHDG